MIAYEDLTVGRVLSLPPYEVTAEEIVEFAAQFDPQPFHLDGESEQAAGVGGLIASGWHTCATAMRMFCDAYLLDSTSQGAPGVGAVRWLEPVRPGDTLSGTSTVREARVSSKRPGLGIVRIDHVVLNQHGRPVLQMDNTGLFLTREAAAARKAAS